MSGLEYDSQPVCPEDGIVMQETRGAWRCPRCGHLELRDDVVTPPAPEGPGLRSG